MDRILSGTHLGGAQVAQGLQIGCRQIPLALQGNAQVAVGLCEVRLDLHSLLKMLDRFHDIALLFQRQAQVVVRLGEIRLDL